MKNLQFLIYHAETLSTLLIHEMVIVTKFHNNWTKIVDFSLIANFKASSIFSPQSLVFHDLFENDLQFFFPD